jgi:hypothetical protein
MSQNYRNIVWSVALVGLLALSGTAFAQQKTVKQCNEEWKANKTAIQASGKKKADFITECRAGEATAAPGGAAAGKSATPPSAATTQPPAGAKPTTSTTTARTGAGTAIGAGQFTTEAQAKTHCPGDTVVWANLDSKIYHFSGNKNYGNTKSGAYMCEKETAAAGVRAAKNEKHP